MKSNHSWTIAKAAKVSAAILALPTLLLSVSSCTPDAVVKLSQKPDVVLIDCDGKDMEPVYKFSSFALSTAVSVRVDGQIHKTSNSERENVENLLKQYLFNQALTIPVGSKTVRIESWRGLRLPNNKIILFGKNVSPNATTGEGDTWLFDLNTRKLENHQTLFMNNSVLTPLNNQKILVTGGVNENGTPSDCSKLFDSKKMTFLPCGKLLQPRFAHSVIQLPNGKVYVVGGKKGNENNQSEYVETIEVLDLEKKTYSEVGKIFGRSNPILVPFGQDKFVVVGGFFTLDNAFNDVRWIRDAFVYPP